MSDIFGKIFGARDKHPSGSTKEKGEKGGGHGGGHSGGSADKGADKNSTAASAAANANTTKSIEFCEYAFNANDFNVCVKQYCRAVWRTVNDDL